MSEKKMVLIHPSAVKVGEWVAIFMNGHTDGDPEFVGIVNSKWSDNDGYPMLGVTSQDQTEKKNFPLSYYSAYDAVALGIIELKKPEPKIEKFDPEAFKSLDLKQFCVKKTPKSFFYVQFRIDQLDLDTITVSGRREGKPEIDDLRKLAIMLNYRKLSKYDGGWWSVGRLRKVFKKFLRGDFYDKANRFKVDGISISGFDAEKNEFYEMGIPSLESLGINNIDEAYKYYFFEDEDD